MVILTRWERLAALVRQLESLLEANSRLDAYVTSRTFRNITSDTRTTVRCRMLERICVSLTEMEQTVDHEIDMLTAARLADDFYRKTKCDPSAAVSPSLVREGGRLQVA